MIRLNFIVRSLDMFCFTLINIDNNYPLYDYLVLYNTLYITYSLQYTINILQGRLVFSYKNLFSNKFYQRR